MKFFLSFFDKKNCLSLGLHKGRQSFRRSLQPSKENIQHFQKMKFINGFLFFWAIFWIFCPLGSVLRIRTLTRIQGPPWIRIHNTGFQLTSFYYGNCFVSWQSVFHISRKILNLSPNLYRYLVVNWKFALIETLPDFRQNGLNLQLCYKGREGVWHFKI